MSKLQELEKITKDLTTKIIDCYKPESTRWKRNHNARAEWYFIWSQNRKIVQLNTEVMIARNEMCEIITKQWYQKMMEILGI